MRVILVSAVLALAGCGILPRNAVPIDLMTEASIPGLPDVRARAGRPSAAMADDFALSFRQEARSDFPVGPDGKIHYTHLALSGGGPNGAFGAGFLNGWTRNGQRPKFKIVTGVSTGALIAPFALLGPEYDDALRRFYTETSSRNIFRRLSIVPQLLGGEALADTGPLQAILAETVDAKFLSEIAKAHLRGQRLYVGTVDLDSQNFVVWNLGLIAISGHPNSLKLFRDVLLASSSIPVAFPPVFFEVEAAGRRYDEMHVDGSVATRVFYNGGLFSFSAVRSKFGTGDYREDVFIIHNGQLRPVPEITRRTLSSIAARSFESAGKTAAIGDLFRIYSVTSREDASFNWITIPEDFDLTGAETFDPVVMGNLYELGYKAAVTGPKWATIPPGLNSWSAP